MTPTSMLIDRLSPGLDLHDPAALCQAIERGALVLDERDPTQFDRGHLPGSLNLPPSLAAGGLRALLADRVDAVVDETVAAAWPLDARLRTSQALDPQRAARELSSGGVALVDVRPRVDWLESQVPGSLNVPLRLLLHGGRPLPALPLLVAGADADEAALAASAIRAAGHPMVWRVAGGGTPVVIRTGVVPGIV
jgi:rhodanese-related sulfurtransferase